MDVEIEPLVAEIPSPEGVRWGARGVVAFGDGRSVERSGPALRRLPRGRGLDSRGHRAGVVVSHFVAINAAIGAALGDDRMVLRSLDNCSVTVVEVDAAALHLVEGGHEADTLIR